MNKVHKVFEVNDGFMAGGKDFEEHLDMRDGWLTKGINNDTCVNNRTW